MANAKEWALPTVCLVAGILTVAATGLETPSQSDVLVVEYNDKRIRAIREKTEYTFQVKVLNCTQGQTLKVKASIPERQKYVATVSQENETAVCEEDAQALQNSTIELSVTLHGWFVGLAELTLTAEMGNNSDMRVLIAGVAQQPELVDKIFQYSMYVFVCLVTLGFGASLDLEVVKAILKRPVAPVIGLVSQYTVMPLLSFILGLVFQLNSAYALGLFALGVSPGGGHSNIWSLVLGGSLDLSITMTFFSCLLSIAMFPFWIYTLGLVLTAGTRVTIPFVSIVVTIALIVVPLSFGVLVRHFLPRAGKILAKTVEPIATVFIVYSFIFGSYANRYIFTLMTKEWETYVTGILLPNVGMGIAALIAYLLKQNRAFVLTISLEVAIQNTVVAVVFLQATLPRPYSDLAIVIPILATLLHNIPFLIALAIRVIYVRRHAKRRQADLALKEPSLCPENGVNKAMLATDCSRESEAT